MTTERTNERRRYRNAIHPAFEFSETVPRRELDKMLPDAAEAMATPEVCQMAKRLRAVVKAKATERGKVGQAISFSERNALEVLCRVGILLNHTERGC